MDRPHRPPPTVRPPWQSPGRGSSRNRPTPGTRHTSPSRPRSPTTMESRSLWSGRALRHAADLHDLTPRQAVFIPVDKRAASLFPVLFPGPILQMCGRHRGMTCGIRIRQRRLSLPTLLRALPTQQIEIPPSGASVGMIRPKCLQEDCERSLVERLGLIMLAFGMEDQCEAIEA